MELEIYLHQKMTNLSKTTVRLQAIDCPMRTWSYFTLRYVFLHCAGAEIYEINAYEEKLEETLKARVQADRIAWFLANMSCTLKFLVL